MKKIENIFYKGIYAELNYWRIKNLNFDFIKKFILSKNKNTNVLV